VGQEDKTFRRSATQDSDDTQIMNRLSVQPSENHELIRMIDNPRIATPKSRDGIGGGIVLFGLTKKVLSKGSASGLLTILRPNENVRRRVSSFNGGGGDDRNNQWRTLYRDYREPREN